VPSSRGWPLHPGCSHLFMRINSVCRPGKQAAAIPQFMSLLTGQLASRFMRINRGAWRQGRHTHLQHGQSLRIRMNSMADHDAQDAIQRASGLKFMRIDSVRNRLRRPHGARNKVLKHPRAHPRGAHKANRPHGLAHGGMFMRINGFSHEARACRWSPLFQARQATPRRRYPAGFQAPSQTPGACRPARRSTPQRHRRAACNNRWNI